MLKTEVKFNALAPTSLLSVAQWWIHILRITCLTRRSYLVLCKHMTDIFSSPHALYESKMASVTVTGKTRNLLKQTISVTSSRLP